MPDIGKRLDNDRTPRRIVGEPRTRRQGVEVVGGNVDTYARPGPSQLGQLAEALSSLAPAVGRLSETFMDRTVAEETAKGKAKANAMAVEGEDWRKAVEKGEVPASASPWFMAALEEESGQVHGHKYGSDLAAAMANSPQLQASLSIEDFDKFEREFRDGWTKQHLGDSPGGRFSAAFNNLVEAEVNTRRRPEFVAGLEKRIRQHASEMFTANTTAFLVKDQEQADDVLLENLAYRRANQLRIGRSIEDIDADTAKALGEAAIATGDFRYLELAKRLPSGTGAELGFNPGAAEVLRKAAGEVASARQMRRREAKAKLEEEKNADLELASEEALTIALSPNPDFTTMLNNKKYTRWGKDFTDLLMNMKNDVGKLATKDESLYWDLVNQMYDPDAPQMTFRTITDNAPILGKEKTANLVKEFRKWQQSEQSRLERRQDRLSRENMHNSEQSNKMVNDLVSEFETMVPVAADNDGAALRLAAKAQFRALVKEKVASGEVKLTGASYVDDYALLSKSVITIGTANKLKTRGAANIKEHIGEKDNSEETNALIPGPDSKPKAEPKGTGKVVQVKGTDRVKAIPAETKAAKAAEFIKLYPGDEEKAKQAYKTWLKEQTK